MIKQDNRLDEMLLTISDAAGCRYLSDLHDPAYHARVADIVNELPDAIYDAELWPLAGEYMLGVPDLDRARLASALRRNARRGSQA